MNLVQFLNNCKSDARVKDRLRDAIQRRATQAGLTRDQLLNLYGCRSSFGHNAVLMNAKPNQVWIRDCGRLAEILRLMNISVSELVDQEPDPFCPWIPGASIAVICGSRVGQLPIAQRTAHADAVSKQDVQAYSKLHAYLLKHISARIVFDVWSSNLEFSDANRRLDQMERDHHAIIVIGSPASNPAAEPLTQRIIPNRKLSYQFRWDDTVQLRRDSNILSNPVACRPDEEGIWQKGHEKPILRRVRDNQHGGRFRDCGMLLINTQSPGPLLILAAGHGSHGTTAAVYGLMNAWKMFSLCHTPNEHQVADGISCVLVEVLKTELGIESGKGWNFFP